MSTGLLERLQPRPLPSRSAHTSTGKRPSLGRALALRVGVFAAATLGGIAAVVLLVAVLGAPAVRSAAGALEIDLAEAGEDALPDLDQRSIVYAADGSVLAVLHDEVDRRVIPLREIPEHVRHAVITAEDRRFHEHEGYDVEGIGRAVLANAREGGIAQGGSTITQQLAKANFVGSEQTVQRKIDELLHAIALERRFSKDELLERYLNQVYFGAGAYGIAAAAEEFFQTSPEDLTVEQAALLAGAIRAPATQDPRANPDAARSRRNQIIAGMADEGYIPAEEVESLQALPLVVAPNVPRENTEPYVVEAVKDEFLSNPIFGEERQDRVQRLFSGGLAIHTTLDPRLQDIAAEVIAEQFPTSDGPTGAIAAVDPRDGRIMALHGGSDFQTRQFDIARLGRRQPGSAFKPFVYAAALEEGFPVSTVLQGSSPAYFPNVRGWTREDAGVRNYNDRSYARMDMREALVRSANTAAAQLMLVVGPDKVVDLAERMGIDVDAMTEGILNPSIALGSPERGVTPLEMAAAFGTFANDGKYLAPHVIERVIDSRGAEVYRTEVAPRRAMEPAVAASMVDMLQDVVRRGTGTGAALLGWEAFGKTGTTQNSYDAWFVGSVPVLSTAVWMGHAGQNVAMPGMTGGSVPASMWQAFMSRALEGVTPVPFPDTSPALAELVTSTPIEVPDVRGMDEAEAMEVLREHKFIAHPQLVGSASRAGEVIWQSPSHQNTAGPGSTVVIGVSTGQAPLQRSTPRRGTHSDSAPQFVSPSTSHETQETPPALDPGPSLTPSPSDAPPASPLEAPPALE